MNKNYLILGLLILTSIGVVSAFNFVEYSGNPIFIGYTSGVDRAYSPYVIKIGDMYNMWYGDGANARYTNSTYADFHDAQFTGTIVTGTNASQPEKFTVYYDASGWTLGGNYYSQPLLAYYTDTADGWTSNPKVAVSDNGINWTFVAQTTGVNGYPIGGSGANTVYRLSVLYDGVNDWKGWADNGGATIQYFVSSDGLAWTGVAYDILNISNPQSWESSNGAISPFVYKEGGVYVMVYSAGLTNNNQGIGFAYSTDGEHFTKDINNPVISIADNVAWRILRTYNGYSIFDGDTWRIYFQGRNSGGSYAIGMMSCTSSWVQNNTVCNGVDYTIQYFDENSCGTINALPIDNGTIVSCSLCTENWVQSNSSCNGNNYTTTYSDQNMCGTYINLPVDNGTSIACSLPSQGSRGIASSGGSSGSTLVSQSALPITGSVTTPVTTDNIFTRLCNRFYSWIVGLFN